VKPVNTTSAGPDGLTARLLKKVPNGILCCILNLILWCERAPHAKDIATRWANQLYARIDGIGLRNPPKYHNNISGYRMGHHFLQGATICCFVKLLVLRINALPTKLRTSRGTHKDKLCRGGCKLAGDFRSHPAEMP